MVLATREPAPVSLQPTETLEAVYIVWSSLPLGKMSSQFDIYVLTRQDYVGIFIHGWNLGEDFIQMFWSITTIMITGTLTVIIN